MPSNWPMSDTERPSAGMLYVVATPIGHLKDITLRALEILAQVDLIAAEDTRHTSRLLSAYGIQTRLISYHEHNEPQRAPELIARLLEGMAIALVSNAGTPMVSDPGYRLIRQALAHPIRVVPIPGASAALTALSVSGLATDTFTFVGFPARRKEKRLRQLEAAAQWPHTLIFYQSPQRLFVFLEELLTVMGDRPAVLAREMTKVHEEFMRGRLSEIAARIATREVVKGECTLLVAGAADAPLEKKSAAPLEDALSEALRHQDRPMGEIAGDLARQYGVPRKTVYALALKMKEDMDDES
jgi:16S rRNA (cytidine1402-2'-O)-methyltransferase